MMKKKLIIFFSFAIVVFILLPLFNYYVDIARVFSKSYDKHYKGQLPNELFLQNEYLLDHQEYTKILFGSSRVGNGIDLTKYDGWYKAWHQGANLEEHLHTLKYILKKGKRIDEITIAIDYLSFFSVATRNDYFRQNAPIEFIDKVKFYNFYLFKKPTKKDFKYFVKKELVANRKHIFSNEAQNMNKDDDYFKNQDIFMGNRTVVKDIFIKNIEAIKQIKQICNEKNIKFSFFINPFHYKNFYGQDIDFILKYKEELAKIDNYYDCSLDISEFTLDSRYWIDVSHYNKLLGDLILGDVFLEKNNLCKKIALNNVKNMNKKFVNENLEKLISLSWSDIKIIPDLSYLKKRIYTQKIEKLHKNFVLNNMDISKTTSEKIFVKMYITINQPTNIKITFGEKTTEQTLQEFNGWPKVSKEHIVGVVVNAADFNKYQLSYDTNKQVRFQKIEIFEI